MPLFWSRGNLTRFLRPTSRFFYIVTIVSFTVSFIWIQNNREEEYSLSDEELTREALQNVAQNHRYAEVYRKKSRLPKGLRYMLLWTPQDYAPFYYFGEGQRGFIKNNCSVMNCYVTADKNFFGGDLSKFDAIAFNGRNIEDMKRSEFPIHRWPHQKYIYFNMESSENYPVCSEIFDGFFNLTSTYRLDSDIPNPYLLIKNNEGEVVGPRRNMEWVKDMHNVDEELSYALQNKTKAAAWFVSNCHSMSGRKEFVTSLQKALQKYKLDVDVYGSCGPLKCPKNQQTECCNKLEKDYFFYMSMENSFAEDYVTEKLLTALQYYVVPIVYGGANYSRFLPPTSYLDARAHSPEDLAARMYQLMQSPDLYREFFSWKSHYTYQNPTTSENICAVCAALNNSTIMETSTLYTDFRSWWNLNYTQRCR